MRGLYDHGNADVALTHPREDAHAVEIGHDEIENDQVDASALGRFQARHRLLA